MKHPGPYKAAVYRKVPVTTYRARTASEEIAAIDNPPPVVERVQFPDPSMTAWQRFKTRWMRYIGS